MMESIKQFFMTNMAEQEEEGADTQPPDLRLAACALLLELAYADDEFTEAEQSHLEAAVRRQFGLDEKQANGLIKLAEEQRAKAVDLWNLGIGLFSGLVFGIIVALAGCMRGMQCGRSASAVGDAATSAVVTAIVGIIVSTAVITVLCNFLGI